jgi:hypothetical protein
MRFGALQNFTDTCFINLELRFFTLPVRPVCEYAICNIPVLSKDVLLFKVSNFATELQDY